MLWASVGVICLFVLRSITLQDNPITWFFAAYFLLLSFCKTLAKLGLLRNPGPHQSTGLARSSVSLLGSLFRNGKNDY